ncbi:hypothetical protein V6N13_138239 [Hibiscus sabdariffa]|uniref:Uncharacterized protein n=1 Tax=Hibiscus sabdariffa TaxID=183260 RepID=A0ABR2QDD8_9ROSI
MLHASLNQVGGLELHIGSRLSGRAIEMKVKREQPAAFPCPPSPEIDHVEIQVRWPRNHPLRKPHFELPSFEQIQCSYQNKYLEPAGHRRKVALTMAEFESKSDSETPMATCCDDLLLLLQMVQENG